MPRLNLLAVVAFLLLLPAAVAQSPRAPAPVPDLGGEPNGAAYARLNEEAHAVAAQTFDGVAGVGVAFQESPGGPWSQPEWRVVNPGSTGLCPTVMIRDEMVFVCWIERVTIGMGTVDAMYFDMVEEPGDPWQGPQRMAGDPAAGSATVLEYLAGVTGTAGNPVALHFLVKLQTAGAPTNELQLISSLPNGSFGPPRHVPDLPLHTADVGRMALRAEAGSAHVAWADERFGGAGVNLFYRALPPSGSGLGAEARLTGSSRVVGDALLLSSAGPRVAVAWLQDEGAGTEALQATLSTNGGASFENDLRVGGYVPGQSDVDSPALAFNATGTTAMLVWADNRAGSDHVYSSARPVAAPQWAADGPVFTASASQPGLIASASAPGQFLTSAVSGGALVGSLTFSTGSAWSDSFTLAPSALSFEMPVSNGFDSLYNDYALSWLAEENGAVHQYHGGIRPQSVVLATDLRSGQPVQFGLALFPPDEAGSGFQVLIAGGTGAVLLPDGRSLGLRQDAWLLATRQLPQLRGILNGNGAGLTSPLNVRLPAGTSIHFMALSKLNGAFGSITDVMTATVAP